MWLFYLPGGFRSLGRAGWSQTTGSSLALRLGCSCPSPSQKESQYVRRWALFRGCGFQLFWCLPDRFCLLFTHTRWAPVAPLTPVTTLHTVPWLQAQGPAELCGLCPIGNIVISTARSALVVGRCEFYIEDQLITSLPCPILCIVEKLQVTLYFCRFTFSRKVGCYLALANKCSWKCGDW